MWRSVSLLRTVLEGRIEGTSTHGSQSDTMIDWMKSNDVEYEYIKKRAYDREDWHHWRPRARFSKVPKIFLSFSQVLPKFFLSQGVKKS